MSMLIVSPIVASCAVILGAIIGTRGAGCAVVIAISSAILVALI